MVEISNNDTERILLCLDIAIEHYKSQKGLRNSVNAWAVGNLRTKIQRKLNNQNQPQKQNDHDKSRSH